MEYLTIEKIKEQCVIDADFTDDDTFLESIGNTAEQLVAQQIDMPLSEVVAKNDGELPAPLEHAMKLIVEYFYDNRGSDRSQIPEAYFYMCRLYRNYN